MQASGLSATTIQYLFASTWAPADRSAWSVAVPGGRVEGMALGANLANLALWSLQRQGLIRLRQVRPVTPIGTVVVGDPSFATVSSADHDAAPTGLEGALWRLVPDSGGAGVRDLVLGLDLHGPSPWTTVAGWCVGEARAAGILAVKGRMRPKPIVDESTLAALADESRKLAEARAQYRAEARDLDAAVAGDCYAALRFAHHHAD